MYAAAVFTFGSLPGPTARAGPCGRALAAARGCAPAGPQRPEHHARVGVQVQPQLAVLLRDHPGAVRDGGLQQHELEVHVREPAAVLVHHIALAHLGRDAL